MPLNVDREQAALERLPIKELQTKYAELFGDATNSRNRAWLVRRILWRLQARDEGDLSERAKLRAREIADDADLRLSPPRVAAPAAAPLVSVGPATSAADRRLPAAGTVITRLYKGKQLQVKVLADGLEYQGEHFKSLSAVAKHVTGSHCNGFTFFGLNDRGGRRD
jgi:hypothetical protein